MQNKLGSEILSWMEEEQSSQTVSVCGLIPNIIITVVFLTVTHLLCITAESPHGWKCVWDDWQHGGCRNGQMRVGLWTDSSYEDLSRKRLQRPSIHWGLFERVTAHGPNQLMIHSHSEQWKHGWHSADIESCSVHNVTQWIHYCETTSLELAVIHHVSK